MSTFFASISYYDRKRDKVSGEDELGPFPDLLLTSFVPENISQKRLGHPADPEINKNSFLSIELTL